jgi:3-methyladenine DNA glycosylase AlkD
MNPSCTRIEAVHTDQVQHALRQLADPANAAHAQRYFKTGPGQYGEGDRFLGIRVPVLRRLAPRFAGADLPVLLELLHSPWHEERLFALLLMTARFVRGNDREQAAVYDLYLANTRWINNWDLVDCSAHQIVGPFLEHRDRVVLRDLAVSASLWERRIAIIDTLHFTRQHDFADCLAVAGLLLHDPHDLIHKAVGWMLREVGKRDQAAEEAFLREHCLVMPRTMLRYAIERLPQATRTAFLQGRIEHLPFPSS